MNQHLSPYLSSLLGKRPESQAAQGTDEPDHVCSCSLATCAGGQQAMGAQARAILMPPASTAAQLAGAMGQGSTKASLAR